ncbi:MAG: hypothetical protein JRN06_08955 [Nitrososphaerota archaeon]|nr:hypothetical protein [Nitrososphaerota archaeon]MDG7024567.1 hypothetical protein [Nitrososphaerota archaeon]
MDVLKPEPPPERLAASGRTLAGKIPAADATKKQEVLPSPTRHPPYVAVLVGVLDEALNVVGGSGANVADAVLSGRYGLHREDLAYNPGEPYDR